MLLKANQEAAAKEEARKMAEKKRQEAPEGDEHSEKPQSEQQELSHEEEEANTARKDAELDGLHAVWKQKIINEHLVYIKGVELVYFEFKEVLLELAMRLKDSINADQGKLRALAKKFLDDLFLKRLTPYIKFNQVQTEASSVSAANIAKRSWPQSEKDTAIKAVMDEREKKEAE